MSDRHSTSKGPRGLDLAVVLASLVTLAGGALFFWAVTSRAPLAPEAAHPLAFRPLSVDTEKLEDSRRRAYGEARTALEGTNLETLYEWVRKSNRAQFPPVDEAERRELGRTLTFKAEDAAKVTGYDAFVAAGEPLFDGCAEGLDALLEQLRDGGLELHRAKTNPPEERFATYRDHCGQFLPTLLERRLVERSGTWAEPARRSRTIADLLQRLRWASLLRDVRMPLLQLSDYGRRILMRWRIETEAYPPKKRRAYLDLLDQNPGLVEGYDTTLARAKLAYGTLGPGRAAELLEEALEEGNAADREGYRRRLLWLRDQMNSRPGGVGTADPESPAPEG